VWLINGIAINELNTIVYYSVNSATCFVLTDQHQADHQYDRMWTVIWKCRTPLLTSCIVTLGVYIYIHKQGDSGGICEIWENDSMCDSKQKSSYEHASDFERLRSYDRLKLRIEGNDY